MIEETIRAIAVGGEVFFRTFLRRDGANRLRKVHAATSGVVASCMAAGIIFSATFYPELKPLARDLVARAPDGTVSIPEARSGAKTMHSPRRIEPDLHIGQNIFCDQAVRGLVDEWLVPVITDGVIRDLMKPAVKEAS